jgi:hypothetical protein
MLCTILILTTTCIQGRDKLGDRPVFVLVEADA